MLAIVGTSVTTPLDRARELREAAREDPDVVNPDHVIELLRYPKRPVQREAAEAFLPLVTAHPIVGAVAVGRIAYLLRTANIEDVDESLGDSSANRTQSDTAASSDAVLAFTETLLLSLARIAGAAPEKALTARQEVLRFLDDPDGALAAPASVCVAQFVEVGSASFVSHVDQFEVLLHAESPDVRRNAAHIMTQLGATHPDAIGDVVPSLRERLRDSDTETAKKAAVALGLAARGDGTALAESVPKLAGMLDADERGLRANAAGALADIAEGLPEPVSNHEEALLARLDDDAAAVRRNAAAALARLADAGASMEGAAQRGFVELLDDPDATVRVTVCQALGHVDSPVVQELLRQTADDDDSPAVRQAAERALESA